MADESRCFHDHPPPIGDRLPDGLEVHVVVVCLHVFGLGVYLPEHAAFGHVNPTHMGVPVTRSLDDYPPVGSNLVASVLGYAGSQDQLRLSVDQ